MDKGLPRVIRRNPCAGPVLPARPIAVVVNGYAKILAEEAEEAAERILPVAVTVRHAQRFARRPGGIARPLDRHVRHPALVALEGGENALVAMHIDVDRFWHVTLGTYTRVAEAMGRRTPGPG